MKTTRARRGLALTAALLLVLTLVPAAMAETTSQDQYVSVGIIQEGILWIGVDDQIHLGNVYPGQLTAPHTFGTGYTNTLAGTAAWSATVTATNFVRYEWVHPEGDPDGSHQPTTDTISYTNLTIFPGYTTWAADNGVLFGAMAAFSGTGITSDAVGLFTAPGTFRGHFGTPHENDLDGNLAAWLQLDVPALVSFGDGEWQADYRATLTYTLTG